MLDCSTRAGTQMNNDLLEYIEMAQSRLRAAMMGDEPCKPCIDLAASYLTEATVLINANAAATPGWQPIEAAPRDGTRLLGTGGGLENTVEMISYNERVAAWDTENYTLDDRDDEAEGYNRPSHWMPLPSPHSRPMQLPPGEDR